MAGGSKTSVRQYPRGSIYQQGIERLIGMDLGEMFRGEGPYGGGQQWPMQAKLALESVLGTGRLPPQYGAARRDYFREAIEAPARRRLNEMLIPQLRSDFAGPGSNFWSGARLSAEQDLYTDWMRNMREAQLAFEQSEEQRQLSNLLTAMNVLQQEPGWLDPQRGYARRTGMEYIGRPTMENIARVTQQPNVVAPLAQLGGMIGAGLLSGKGGGEGGASSSGVVY